MKADNSTLHAEKIKSLVDSVYRGPGHSDIQLRLAVAQKVAAHCGRVSENGLSLPEVLETYVAKIARHAYKVTDADVNALRDAGYSEDVIHVTVLFNIIDRIFDSRGFAIPSAKSFASIADILIKRGY